ncbi:hypothetical protein C8R45DRAFT_1113328 [Mycena sanguinolenta]|nr:hypothetical protein C8R45DRAFT_1113328 [Mycena sanguinolenta]
MQNSDLRDDGMHPRKPTQPDSGQLASNRRQDKTASSTISSESRLQDDDGGHVGRDGNGTDDNGPQTKQRQTLLSKSLQFWTFLAQNFLLLLVCSFRGSNRRSTKHLDEAQVRNADAQDAALDVAHSLQLPPRCRPARRRLCVWQAHRSAPRSPPPLPHAAPAVAVTLTTHRTLRFVDGAQLRTHATDCVWDTTSVLSQIAHDGLHSLRRRLAHLVASPTAVCTPPPPPPAAFWPSSPHQGGRRLHTAALPTPRSKLTTVRYADPQLNGDSVRSSRCLRYRARVTPPPPLTHTTVARPHPHARNSPCSTTPLAPPLVVESQPPPSRPRHVNPPVAQRTPTCVPSPRRPSADAPSTDGLDCPAYTTPAVQHAGHGHARTPALDTISPPPHSPRDVGVRTVLRPRCADSISAAAAASLVLELTPRSRSPRPLRAALASICTPHTTNGLPACTLNDGLTAAVPTPRCATHRSPRHITRPTPPPFDAGRRRRPRSSSRPLSRPSPHRLAALDSTTSTALALDASALDNAARNVRAIPPPLDTLQFKYLPVYTSL